jgi:hypothetical protein
MTNAEEQIASLLLSVPSNEQKVSPDFLKRHGHNQVNDAFRDFLNPLWGVELHCASEDLPNIGYRRSRNSSIFIKFEPSKF